MAGNQPKLHIIVLAAGKGKRMNSDLPKALLPVQGKPMILYLLDSIKKSKLCNTPVVVIGQNAELVKKTLGNDYIFVDQKEQLGTANAVLRAKNILSGKSQHVLVLYADQPFVRPETLQKIIDVHVKEKRVVTLATIKVPDFKDWRIGFYQFGRIKRDKNEKFEKIVELKDATESEKEILELSPTYFCFRADWLWENIEKVENNNAQNEYYLTDLIPFALKQGHSVTTVEVDSKEAMGANTEEQLRIMEDVNFKF